MADKWKYADNWVSNVEAACAAGLDGVCRPIAEGVAGRARAAENADYAAHVHVVKQTRLKRKGAGLRQAGYVVLAAGSHAVRVEAKRGTLARSLRGA